MVSRSLERELLDEVGRLDSEQQQDVLRYARTLAAQPTQGVAGDTLLRFAGAFDADDLKAMAAAIHEGCEKVDESGW